MNAEQLKAAQAPLKEKYRQDPATAQVPMHVEGSLLPARIAVKIETGHGRVEAGLHPAAGGDGSFACSGDMLLESLGACAAVTMEAVATAMGIAIRGGKVFVDGDTDFRGTLGVDKSAPVGFKDIRIRFDLDTDATPEQLATLYKLTERYCVIFQTLKNPPPVSLAIDVRGAVAA